MDPTKLSKNKMLLTGIGEAQVTTIGSFEHKFKIDDENYSLTWHVVPTDKLKFEAVIGSDLLEQASISFTKEGVKLNKYENDAQLMQISAESALEKLKQQQKTFGNPIRIISDRGSAFTSKLFNDYCDEENIQHLQIATEQREFLRNDAKKNIETLQSENRKTYNRRRKKASLYKEGDLVAIQRTQFGAGLKLRPKLGPYKVTKVNSKDRYQVEKVGEHDGPNSTTTSADLMKHFYA
ncbi:transposon Tf2-9 polyprotein [Trichonephila clavipes]|nr:transposon Tf2-9 polyprotein [Trichonephila clavipes]